MIKQPPLLNPPSNDEGQWLKIDYGIVQVSRKRLQRSAEVYHMHNRESELDHILDLAVYLDALDYDVADDIRKIEKQVRAKMTKDANSNDMQMFIKFAANMSQLGFDVKDEVEENREKIIGYVEEEAPKSLKAFAIMHYARAKQAGVDVSKWVKDGKARIGEEEEDMRELFRKSTMVPAGKLMLAHALKTLNVDVTDLMEAEKQNITKAIQLHKSERPQQALSYLKDISILNTLRLLEPKINRHQPPMPPLKEVTR